MQGLAVATARFKVRVASVGSGLQHWLFHSFVPKSVVFFFDFSDLFFTFVVNKSTIKWLIVIF